MAKTFLMICALLTVVDGDTVKCDGQNLRPMGNGSPFISGFDAPETGNRAKCLAERLLAEKAKNRLAQLIETPGLEIETSGQVDRYKRPLVWLRLPNGTTVGQTLINEGLAEEWRPDKIIKWCE